MLDVSSSEVNKFKNYKTIFNNSYTHRFLETWKVVFKAYFFNPYMKIKSRLHMILFRKNEYSFTPILI